MLNEIIEDTKNMRNVKVECFNIYLTENQKMRLVLEFTLLQKRSILQRKNCG